MKKAKRSTIDAPTEDAAPYFFHQGTSIRAFDYLGVHREGESTVFRVWAPNADFVSVMGDFNGWCREAAPMKRVTERGVWEVSLPSNAVWEGGCYKYFIRNGCRELEKADPYAMRAELPPHTASVVYFEKPHSWRDASWMRYRKSRFTRERLMKQPINIYELHPASWKKRGDGSCLSYVELAAELVTYVKQMGYTHIELMPLAEYPFEGSWGYQVCGYYAPTARFGTPEELKQFVDSFHEAGIGVILDWVPAHFPKDAHGLYEFDGQPLYEYQGPDRMEHPSWGTRCFDVGREEVQSFLISNAVYWAEKFHVDGLRVDAVASMLYLDYDRKPGEWIPNEQGGNVSPEAVAFFRKFNGCFAKHFPDVMTIAEESTAFGNLTTFAEGGLGFSLKWNMGWMNDSLAYLREDPIFRKHHHNKMNFSITYAFGEKYVLPVSHDEVVHGKRSLLDRSPLEYRQKFADTRVFLAYLMTHPGKKLLFMGCEIGQFREWDYEGQTEWFLLDYPMHAALQLYTAELNHLYLKTPALWQRDESLDGFCWIDPDNAEQSIFSYRRIDEKGGEAIVLLNFTPVGYGDFLLAVPEAGRYREIFNSDAERFGGEDRLNAKVYSTEPCMLRGYGNAIRIQLPPLSALIFRRVGKATKKQQGYQ